MEEVKDVIFYEKDARDMLVSGINKLADAVKVTLGPLGKTVLIRNPNGVPTVTKDGVSVAKAVRLINPIEDMGAQLVQQVSSKTVDAVGDGTTTSTVIAQSLINVEAEIRNVTEFRRGMEETSARVIKFLGENVKDCNKEISLPREREFI